MFSSHLNVPLGWRQKGKALWRPEGLEVDTQGRNIPVPGTRWLESGTLRWPKGQVRERNCQQLASS
jgi:hypothetical protein